MKPRGRAYLIGAGPGDPELLTLKAVRMLGEAQAVVYDRLVSDEVLALAPEGARMISVGKAPGRHSVPQERINEILVELAGQGLTVARLKGGDPFIFGRGGEEAQALREAGIPVEIAPGITAAQGAAAALGVPLTHRGLATGVRYVTGHCRQDLPLDLDWRGLADADTTLVVYMGAASIGRIAARMIAAGAAPDLPALAVCAATTPRQRRVATRLDRVAQALAAEDLDGPTLVVIGRVAGLAGTASTEAIASLARRAAAGAAEPVHA